MGSDIVPVDSSINCQTESLTAFGFENKTHLWSKQPGRPLIMIMMDVCVEKSGVKSTIAPKGLTLWLLEQQCRGDYWKWRYCIFFSQFVRWFYWVLFKWWIVFLGRLINCNYFGLEVGFFKMVAEWKPIVPIIYLKIKYNLKNLKEEPRSCQNQSPWTSNFKRMWQNWN